MKINRTGEFHPPLSQQPYKLQAEEQVPGKVKTGFLISQDKTEKIPVRNFIPWWLPVDTFIRTRTGLLKYLKVILWLIPCWHYVHWPLSDKQRLEWAILDTFDALAPRYDYPETVENVQTWCQEAGLCNIDVFPGGNGVIANTRKPQRSS